MTYLTLKAETPSLQEPPSPDSAKQTLQEQYRPLCPHLQAALVFARKAAK
jgi:hypothetical protein